jgi:hypothetical protein
MCRVWLAVVAERGMQPVDVLHYLAGVGVASRGALGEDRAPVDVYFKPALVASHEGKGLQVVSELVYDLARQPGGACAVVSLLAVDDGYFH